MYDWVNNMPVAVVQQWYRVQAIIAAAVSQAMAAGAAAGLDRSEES